MGWESTRAPRNIYGRDFVFWLIKVDFNGNKTGRPLSVSLFRDGPLFSIARISCRAIDSPRRIGIFFFFWYSICLACLTCKLGRSGLTVEDMSCVCCVFPASFLPLSAPRKFVFSRLDCFLSFPRLRAMERDTYTHHTRLSYKLTEGLCVSRGGTAHKKRAGVRALRR